MREAEYDISESKVRDYLSLDNVKGGIFFLANRLYGITFRPVTVPLYNEECEAYEVLDTDDTTLGILYFDFHPRAGKQGGAWCGTFTEPLYDSEGRRQGPAVSVVCNFTPPSGRTPGAAVAGRDADALPRVRACAALPLLGGALSRPVGGRG